jgi:hypothetical protein
VDLENAIAVLHTAVRRLARLEKYASDRNLPAFVRDELRLAQLDDLDAMHHLGIAHGQLERAIIEERSSTR